MVIHDKSFKSLMNFKQEDSLELTLKSKPSNPVGRIKWMVTSWFVKHPHLWINPLSVSNVYRAVTGSLRILPSFIIIGAAKCGTTSMYEYLIQHPNVYPSFWKEIYFFDRYFPRGVNWYRGNFMFQFHKKILELKQKPIISGDATPTYIHHPLAPKRIFETIPNIKLIALVRNPTDRAYSHYKMEVKLGFETLSFEEALEKEEERLMGEEEKMINDKFYFSYKRQLYSYRTSGIYVEQLERWLKFFPKDQILIIKSEDLEADPLKELNKVFQFLALKPYSKLTFEKHNVGSYSQMNVKTRANLTEFYKPYNKKLSELVGKDLTW